MGAYPDEETMVRERVAMSDYHPTNLTQLHNPTVDGNAP